MISIIVRAGKGKTTIEIDGHANSAPYGQDIVCAAVSAIAHTTSLGLMSVAERYPEHVRMRYIDEEEGDEVDSH